MRVVKNGPSDLTGIRKRANTNPHKIIVRNAYGIPLDSTNSSDLLKSLIFTDIKTTPVIMIAIAINLFKVRISEKNSTANRTVKMEEEFAMGTTTPIFPIFTACINETSDT